MKLRISSWNVRGLHDPDKGKVIKSVVRKLKPDLACFQETKMREMSDKFVRSLGTGRNLGWASLGARAQREGFCWFGMRGRSGFFLLMSLNLETRLFVGWGEDGGRIKFPKLGSNGTFNQRTLFFYSKLFSVIILFHFDYIYI